MVYESKEESTSMSSYLPWREEEFPIELSGKATLCITYLREENMPRTLSLKYGKQLEIF